MHLSLSGLKSNHVKLLYSNKIFFFIFLIFTSALQIYWLVYYGSLLFHAPFTNILKTLFSDLKQASSQLWFLPSSARWCSWSVICSVTRAPTTPTKPKGRSLPTALTQPSLWMTPPSQRPLTRARRNGSFSHVLVWGHVGRRNPLFWVREMDTWQFRTTSVHWLACLSCNNFVCTVSYDSVRTSLRSNSSHAHLHGHIQSWQWNAIDALQCYRLLTNQPGSVRLAEMCILQAWMHQKLQ